MGFINLEERGNFLVIVMDFTDPKTQVVRHCLLTKQGWKEVPEGTDWRHLPGVMMWKKDNRAQAEHDYTIVAGYAEREKLKMDASKK